MLILVSIVLVVVFLVAINGGKKEVSIVIVFSSGFSIGGYFRQRELDQVTLEQMNIILEEPLFLSFLIFILLLVGIVVRLFLYSPEGTVDGRIAVRIGGSGIAGFFLGWIVFLAINPIERLLWMKFLTLVGIAIVIIWLGNALETIIDE